jgi:nucleoporin NUP82
MLAVYETIDLGLIDLLAICQPPLLSLLQGNHMVLFADPIHEDTVYVYHAFGVHVIQLGQLVQHLAASLRIDDDDETGSIKTALEKDASTTVIPILTTFSIERRCSNPVIAVTIPNDVFLTYSILILTSSMRITCFLLNLRPDSPTSDTKALPSPSKSPAPKSLENGKSQIGPHYFSLLEAAPFTPPAALNRPHGLPANPRLSLGSGAVDTQSKEFMLTPETLRYFASTVERLTSQIHDIQLAFRDTIARSSLQAAEGQRQKDKLGELSQRIKRLSEGKKDETRARIERLKDGQGSLLGKTDKVLRRLMEEASPGLSEHEKKWFEELKRMKGAIEGEGRFDEESLVARTASLEKEYARLLPKLKELRSKEADHRRQSSAGECTPTIGASQAMEIDKRSANERKKIESLEKKLLEMASALEISLGKPS